MATVLGRIYDNARGNRAYEATFIGGDTPITLGKFQRFVRALFWWMPGLASTTTKCVEISLENFRKNLEENAKNVAEKDLTEIRAYDVKTLPKHLKRFEALVKECIILANKKNYPGLNNIATDAELGVYRVDFSSGARSELGKFERFVRWFSPILPLDSTTTKCKRVSLENLLTALQGLESDVKAVDEDLVSEVAGCNMQDIVRNPQLKEFSQLIKACLKTARQSVYPHLHLAVTEALKAVTKAKTDNDTRLQEVDEKHKGALEKAQQDAKALFAEQYKTIERLQAEVQNLKKDHPEVANAIKLTKQVQDLTNAVAEANNNHAEAEKKLTGAIQALETEKSELSTRVSTLQTEATTSLSQNTNLTNEVVRLKATIATLTQQAAGNVLQKVVPGAPEGDRKTVAAECDMKLSDEYVGRGNLKRGENQAPIVLIGYRPGQKMVDMLKGLGDAIIPDDTFIISKDNPCKVAIENFATDRTHRFKYDSVDATIETLRQAGEAYKGALGKMKTALSKLQPSILNQSLTYQGLHDLGSRALATFKEGNESDKVDFRKTMIEVNKTYDALKLIETTGIGFTKVFKDVLSEITKRAPKHSLEKRMVIFVEDFHLIYNTISRKLFFDNVSGILGINNTESRIAEVRLAAPRNLTLNELQEVVVPA